MSKAHHPWTPEEDRRLIALINDYRSKNGDRIAWRQIPNGKMWRTSHAMNNRWNHTLKPQCMQKDGKYILPQTELDMEPPKVKVVHQTPLKVKKFKKSFLWGLYTVEREE